jgi:hypothetical protein
MNLAPGKMLIPLLAALISQSVLTATPDARKSETDEVLVHGQRMKLDEMRKEIVQLEDRFYERYNELNTVRDFDVHCIVEARTGTRFDKRSCRAVYMEDALQEEGAQAFQARQIVQDQLRRGSSQPVVSTGPPVPATVKIEARREEFRKNVAQVAGQDAELAQVLRQRAELIERYRAARRKMFGKHPPPDESDPTAAAMP